VSYEEKSTWAYAAIAVIIPIAYFATVLPQLSTTPVADIEYQLPLLTAIGAAIVAAVVTAIVIAISAPSEAGKSDQRDREVGRFGEYVGGSITAVLAVVPFLLSLAEVDWFWISNSLYLAFSVGAFAGALAKIWAYRRGL
jgi:hypothetical protein